MKKVVAIIFLLPILLASCKSQKEGSSVEVVQEVILDQLSYLPKVSPYRASETKFFDLVHTKLNVSFDWTNRYLIGKANVQVVPHAYAQNKLVLDAKGFDIRAVNLVSDTAVREVTFEYDSLYLEIYLDRMYMINEKIEVEIDYVAKPDEIKNIKSGYGAIKEDKGLYFINPDGEEQDKPKQIWTQGETEASSCWFPTIDAPNQKMTQELYITVDTSYVVLSNGELVYTTDNGDGTKTTYWKQEKPHAPYLAMMAIGEFAKIEDSWRGLEVNYYVEKDYAPYARDIFGNTPEMLSFFSDLLSYEYPWDKYSQIIVRDYVSGAMENTSASVYMEQLQMTDRELLDKDFETTIAHELFHHWFGDLVTCESWSNLPLNESFANYSEYLWLEHKYGKDEADYHRNEEINGYLNEAQKKREPLLRYHYGHRMEMFDAHSYNKGGLVLHMLRDYLGDEVFFKSLNLYLRSNEYTDVEVHQLRLAFERVSGQDLNWFFNQWFFSPGHPELLVTDTFKNEKLYLTVEQLQNIDYHDSTQLRSNAKYQLPVDIAFYVGNRKFVKTVTIDSLKQTFLFDIDRKPDLIVFDDKQVLLAEVTHNKSVSALAFQLQKSFTYQLRYNAVMGLQGQVADGAQLDEYFGQAVADAHWSIRKEAWNYLAEMKYANPSLVQKAKVSFNTDKKSRVRSAALAYLDAVADSPSEYLALYTKGLADRSFMVNATALTGYLGTDADDKGTKVVELRDVKSASMVNAIIKYYIEVGDSTQFNWIQSKYESFGAGEKIAVVDNVAYYLMLGGVSQDDFNDGVTYFHDLGMNDNSMYVRYTAFRALFRLDSVTGVRELRKEILENEKDDFLKGVMKNWEATVETK